MVGILEVKNLLFFSRFAVLFGFKIIVFDYIENIFEQSIVRAKLSTRTIFVVNDRSAFSPKNSVYRKTKKKTKKKSKTNIVL